ncbi:MAG: hypothetical protein WDM92_02660 [Caulobacteraceae bacterium]
MTWTSIALRLAWLAAAAAPSFAQASTLELAGDSGLALALSTDADGPNAPTAGSQADLTATLAHLNAGLHFGLQAGDSGGQVSALSPLPLSPAGSVTWNSRQAGLDAAWTPWPRAKLEISGSDLFRSESDEAAAYALGDEQLVATRQSRLSATGSFDPLAPLHLQVGAEIVRNAVRNVDVGDGAWTTIATDTQRTFATAQWRLSSRLQLEGGSALQTMDVAWRSSQTASASYAYLRPRLSGVIIPWSTGQWRLSVERVVSDPDTAAFASFAQAADGAGVFEPDHAWLYQAVVNQQLPRGAALSASFSRSVLESVTELGPVGQTQAPMDIGTGRQRQIDISLTTPVQLFDLPVADLRGSATWRTSEVTDPFTRARRQASGETPYQAELDLAQTLSPGLQWGLKGQIVGAQSLYQMSQVTSLSPTAGLGGYLAFAPGPFAVRLEADNLLGGDRTNTDTYFLGSRASGQVERISQGQTTARSFAVSLTRPF